jgi:C-terminal processing protease CtpA/Prc
LAGLVTAEEALSQVTEEELAVAETTSIIDGSDDPTSRGEQLELRSVLDTTAPSGTEQMIPSDVAVAEQPSEGTPEQIPATSRQLEPSGIVKFTETSEKTLLGESLLGSAEQQAGKQISDIPVSEGFASTQELAPVAIEKTVSEIAGTEEEQSSTEAATVGKRVSFEETPSSALAEGSETRAAGIIVTELAEQTEATDNKDDSSFEALVSGSVVPTALSEEFATVSEVSGATVERYVALEQTGAIGEVPHGPPETGAEQPSATISRVVQIPPGKLGVSIDTTIDGPVVRSVKSDSPLQGMIFPGDIIVAVDEEDTREMSGSAITSLMVRTAGNIRNLTVLSTSSVESAQPKEVTTSGPVAEEATVTTSTDEVPATEEALVEESRDIAKEVVVEESQEPAALTTATKEASVEESRDITKEAVEEESQMPAELTTATVLRQEVANEPHGQIVRTIGEDEAELEASPSLDESPAFDEGEAADIEQVEAKEDEEAKLEGVDEEQGQPEDALNVRAEPETDVMAAPPAIILGVVNEEPSRGGDTDESTVETSPSVIPVSMASSADEETVRDDDDTVSSLGSATRAIRRVEAPAGKLGIILDTTSDGPLVISVKPESPMVGLVHPGDTILAVDDVETRAMSSSAFTSLMVRTAGSTRILTVTSKDPSQ